MTCPVMFCPRCRQAIDEEGAPWELLYNLGTALVQRGAAGDAAMAEKCLEQAGRFCREVRHCY